MDTIDRWRVAIAGFSCVVLLAAVAVLSGSDRVAKPMRINGDSLGQETSESFDEYVRRATESIASAQSNGDYIGYALVTFRPAQSAQVAGAVVGNIARVNAIQIPDNPVVGIPEPVHTSRADQIVQQLHIHNLPADKITGVVVRDRISALARLSHDPAVAAVEILPPDAAWNQFSVRPVRY
ncbi:MAG: hypothetical protein Q4D85_08805 [Corynebacterium sp.]|uniref:hypothetical protein n=1 Tax=Corynebacterium sp. TaxID=1720 RepID=UPI0026DA9452|nr:hypothetical protein [Corynebacterium sp.]MDO5098846.1 hypothetical protein [Corynebacterium sp.]